MSQTDFSNEIANWAEDNLSEQWQHDLLADVAGGVALSSEYVCGIANKAVEAAYEEEDCWFQPIHVTETGGKRNFSADDFGIRKSSERPIRLLKVLHQTGVNRLQNDQAIEFDPAGMTVIFGKNGSGKSGYARILKKFAASRGDNRILPNALTAATTIPQASICFLEGSEEKQAEWTGNEKFVDSSFQRVRVYDSLSAHSLLADELTIAYSPTQIKVLSRFAEALGEVKTELDGRLSRLELAEKQVGGHETEKFEEFLNDLKLLDPKSAKDAIEGIQEFSKSQAEELASLEERFARLKLDSKEVLLKRIEGRKAVARSERTKAAAIRDVLQSFTPNKAAKARKELERAKNTVREIQGALGQADRLQICATNSWPHLWESVGNFFATLPASHERYASEVSQWKACPVCHQDLDLAAKDRLLAFEQFAQGEANQRLKNAEATLEAATTSLNRIREYFDLEIPERSKSLVDGLEVSGDLGTAINYTFIDFYSSAKRLLVAIDRELVEISAESTSYEEALSSGELAVNDANIVVEKFKVLDDLLDLAERELNREARELHALDSKGNEQESLGERIAALEFCREAFNHRQALKEAHDTQLRKAAYVAASKKCNGRSATNLVKKLSNDFIGEISSRFSIELADLGFDPSIPVKLELAKTSKGVSYIKPQYNSQKSNVMGEILSEGEQRIVSMAGFFADLTGSKDSSCLIFDDPVTSLDHRFREKVARRLIRESAIRQVVIFSHDFAFVQLLEQMLWEENLSRSVDGQSRLPEISEVEIYRRADGAGSLSPVDWRRRNLKKQIGALKNEMQRLEVLERKQPDEYPVAGESFLGAVRETWERVVEETLLNSAVVRMDPAVHTRNLRPLTDIGEDDLDAIELGMTIESRVMRGHSKAGEIAAQDFPNSSILREELDRLVNLHTSVQKRRQ